jgi:UTP--glucose-1-phosphate uridylyltransferase
MIKKAILPVAGLGTRFLPASKSIPKEMVTVVDRPAIEYVVKEAVAAGIEEIILVKNYLITSFNSAFNSLAFGPLKVEAFAKKYNTTDFAES